MPAHVCPAWLGYFLLFPWRKWLENPNQILGPLVRPGMTVLEPGCGMGYFTLPLARMVGPEGRIVAVDIQPKMLAALTRRARKAGLADRIEIRLAQADRLGIEDLDGRVDLVSALHMIHEVPDQTSFFQDIWTALKPGGLFFIVEPKAHVKAKQFEQGLAKAEEMGFKREEWQAKARGWKTLLRKTSIQERDGTDQRAE